MLGGRPAHGLIDESRDRLADGLVLDAWRLENIKSSQPLVALAWASWQH